MGDDQRCSFPIVWLIKMMSLTQPAGFALAAGTPVEKYATSYRTQHVVG
jgi:hypothetical protein